jgi:hypothetical protein
MSAIKPYMKAKDFNKKSIPSVGFIASKAET